MKTASIAALSLILIAVTAPLFAHAGEVHSYMGTITASTNEGFTMKTTKGEEVSFGTAAATTYRFSDNAPATRADIVAGARVVVEIAKDGRTATKIRIARRAK